jgi:uridine kinase
VTEPDKSQVNAETVPVAQSLATLLSSDYALGERGRAVIAIAGESGSGKSVTAAALARELDALGIATGVINQDDYFYRPPRTNHEHRLLDLANVGPHEVNLELVQSHIDAFREGRDNVSGPRVDYPANRFVTREHHFSALRVLIVEGTYVLGLRGIDVRIFLEATHEDTRERRRQRNRDIDAPIIDRILAIEHDLIAPQGASADVIIDRDFTIRPRG